MPEGAAALLSLFTRMRRAERRRACQRNFGTRRKPFFSRRETPLVGLPDMTPPRLRVEGHFGRALTVPRHALSLERQDLNCKTFRNENAHAQRETRPCRAKNCTPKRWSNLAEPEDARNPSSHTLKGIGKYREAKDAIYGNPLQVARESDLRLSRSDAVTALQVGIRRT